MLAPFLGNADALVSQMKLFKGLDHVVVQARNEVACINTVPSAMAELLRSGRLPCSVRVINLAGEPLRNVLVEEIFRQTSVQRVYNLYGPSEDTTYSTFALIYIL